MDEGEYKTLAAVPDPRQRRGQRYPWRLLLVLIVAAVASGQPHGRAIGQWVQEHASELRTGLGWRERRLPSAATLRRALLTIDLAVLEAEIGRLVGGPDTGNRATGIAAQALGHGRWETRRLEASTRLNAYLAEDGWPDVARVLHRTCRRVVLRTGGVSHTTTYALTSLPATAVPLATVEAVWRGHWGIENRVHHVRDVSFREDAGQAHSGHIVQALAVLRNGLLSCLRAAGWTRIADALRHYAAHLDETLALIGAIS